MIYLQVFSLCLYSTFEIPIFHGCSRQIIAKLSVIKLTHNVHNMQATGLFKVQMMLSVLYFTTEPSKTRRKIYWR